MSAAAGIAVAGTAIAAHGGVCAAARGRLAALPGRLRCRVARWVLDGALPAGPQALTAAAAVPADPWPAAESRPAELTGRDLAYLRQLAWGAQRLPPAMHQAGQQLAMQLRSDAPCASDASLAQAACTLIARAHDLRAGCINAGVSTCNALDTLMYALCTAALELSAAERSSPQAGGILGPGRADGVSDLPP